MVRSGELQSRLCHALAAHLVQTGRSRAVDPHARSTSKRPRSCPWRTLTTGHSATAEPGQPARGASAGCARVAAQARRPGVEAAARPTQLRRLGGQAEVLPRCHLPIGCAQSLYCRRFECRLVAVRAEQPLQLCRRASGRWLRSYCPLPLRVRPGRYSYPARGSGFRQPHRWHTYGVDWEPRSVTYCYDGVKMAPAPKVLPV